MRDPLGILLGFFWDWLPLAWVAFVLISGSNSRLASSVWSLDFLVSFGIVLGSFRDRLGILLGFFWDWPPLAWFTFVLVSGSND